MTQMEELVAKLNEASDAYYNGKEIMTNKEFDDLVDQLKGLEAMEGPVLSNSPTRNVGAPVTDGLPKFKHTYPALSLDKTKDIDEFIAKFRKGIADSGEPDKKWIVLMYKEDGSTVQAYYKSGKLDRLVTRGNGEVGSVITQNANIIEGLPKELPYPIDMVVRGEAVMSYKEFGRINSSLPDDEKYANPRNLASATLTMIDREEVKKRHLVLQAFNLVYVDSHLEDHIAGQDLEFDKQTANIPKAFSPEYNAAGCRFSFGARLRFLQDCGFNVVENLVVSLDELKDAVDVMTNRIADPEPGCEYDYPVDGLVAAMDNYEYTKTLKGTEHHPHIMSGYAFKWADETKETTIRDIEWSPSRTGLLNPVAIFDPIELEGTTVKRASLHNLSIMRDMRIHIGDKITVYKANMIIPQVDKNLLYDQHTDYTDDFVDQLIGCCPTCGAKAVVHKSEEGIETVYCPNKDCPEKMIGKLAHFCERDCMDIQGMSEETIKKLVNAKFIKQYADFFQLDQLPGISFLPGFGKQSWKKMCHAAEVARKTTFVKFATAIGIPNFGKGQAKTLLKYINENYDELVAFSGYDKEEYNPFLLLAYLVDMRFSFEAIPGFGSSLHRDITKWFEDCFTLGLLDRLGTPETQVFNMLEFTDTKPSGEASADSPISGKSFCITGKLISFSNRQELVSKIESLGGKWVDSVSGRTDYLINNDVTSTSGKNKKAKELNIPIISEEDFLNMVE